MNKFFILVLASFLFSSFALAKKTDKWEQFFEESGFPRKVIDDGSVVSGKLLDSKITYQILNNDGKKGNFEGSDSAIVTITNKKGDVISTNEFLTVLQLRNWGKENFMEIMAFLIGERKLDQKTLMDITSLATLALSNKNLD